LKPETSVRRNIPFSQSSLSMTESWDSHELQSGGVLWVVGHP